MFRRRFRLGACLRRRVGRLDFGLGPALFGRCFLGQHLLDLGFLAGRLFRRRFPGRRLRPALGLLCLGLAFLIELYELVIASQDDRDRGLAVQHRVGDSVRIELNRPHRIIVTGNDVSDGIGRTVGIDNCDHRNTEFRGFFYRDLFMPNVDDEHSVRQGFHILDAAERSLEFAEFSA